MWHAPLVTSRPYTGSPPYSTFSCRVNGPSHQCGTQCSLLSPCTTTVGHNFALSGGVGEGVGGTVGIGVGLSVASKSGVGAGVTSAHTRLARIYGAGTGCINALLPLPPRTAASVLHTPEPPNAGSRERGIALRVKQKGGCPGCRPTAHAPSSRT